MSTLITNNENEGTAVAIQSVTAIVKKEHEGTYIIWFLLPDNSTAWEFTSVRERDSVYASIITLWQSKVGEVIEL